MPKRSRSRRPLPAKFVPRREASRDEKVIVGVLLALAGIAWAVYKLVLGGG